MHVLILSKTQYGTSQFCIGGIVVNSNEFIRLLEPGGYYQPRNTELKIGDIWDINFRRAASTREPHNEDVIVTSKTYVKKIYGLKTYINNSGVRIWRGDIINAFDGNLQWANSGSGFLSESQPNFPDNSVGFWVPDNDLTFHENYFNVNGKRLPYKGTETPKPTIPRGSLIRLSLAKWWCPENFYESRCYLQLSGWYEDEAEPSKKEFQTKKKQRIGPTLEELKNLSAKELYEKYPTPAIKNYLEKREESSKKIERFKRAFEEEERRPKTKKEQEAIDRASHKLWLRKTLEDSGYKVTDEEIEEHIRVRSGNNSGSCYIATVCYNNYYAEEVCTFRDFRDHTLLKSALGKIFVKNYYLYAPKISKVLEGRKTMNFIIKTVFLDPLFSIIKSKGWDRKQNN